MSHFRSYIHISIYAHFHHFFCIPNFDFDFVNGGRVSEALVKENKNYQVNILQNKTMAKTFTMVQLKELLDIHENIIIKIFTNRVENLEPKITSMQEENKQLKSEVETLQVSIEFQNETYKKIKKKKKKKKTGQ